MPSNKARYIQSNGYRPGTSGQSMGNEDDLPLGMVSPYNPPSNANMNPSSNGGLIIRKRSGTSHAQKSSLNKNNPQGQYNEDYAGAHQDNGP